jgi:proteasome lid subunit RPN8/RPN11
MSLDNIKLQISKEGELAYPNECCGFILEDYEIIPVDNSREDEEQYHRFVITPEDFLHAELTAQKHGSEIIGIYHSHPDHPAKPSDYDREHGLPFYSYVIVAVEKGVATDITSWKLSDDRQTFIQEDLNWL